MRRGSLGSLAQVAAFLFCLSQFTCAGTEAQGATSTAAFRWELLQLRSLRQRETWGGGGAVVQALAWSPANPLRVLLGTGRNGIWYSRDGGKSFRPASGCSLPAVKAFCFVPWQSGEAYCLAGVPERASLAAIRREGLYRSRDGGASWGFVASVPLEEGVYGALLACGRFGSETLIMAGSQGRGILLSRDGGKRWEWAQVGREGWIAGVEYVGRTVLLATSDGVFRSRDGLRSCCPVPELQEVRFAAVRGPVFTTGAGEKPAVYLASPRGLLCSEDEGTSWVELSGGQVPPKRIPRWVVADRRTPGLLLAGFERNSMTRPLSPFLFSTDGGRTFTQPVQINARGRFTGPSAVFSEAAVFHPQAAGVVLAGVDRELMRSNDGGAHWEAWGSGFFGWPTEGVFFAAVDPADPTRLYLTLGPGGLWVSPNGGIFFRRLVRPPGECVAVAVHPDPEQKALFLWVRNRRRYTLYVSFNRGRSWQVAATPEMMVTPTVFFHPLRAEIIYAGPLVSRDGGKHFRPLGPSVLGVEVREGRALYGFDPRNPWQLLRSTDGGQCWKAWGKQLPAPPLCFLPQGGESAEGGLVGTRYGLFSRLEDGTWKRCIPRSMVPGEMAIVAIVSDPSVPGRVIATARRRFLRSSVVCVSHDGGDTWQAEEKAFSVTGLARWGAGRFLAATDRGLFVVTVSPRLGK